MPEPRWREIGGPVGRLEPGALNAITDVPGVRVAHSQAESGERTGVTVVAPPQLPIGAGVSTVNGTGELTGKLEISERGELDSPVFLCGSHAVGTVFQAAVAASGRGPERVVLPVVGECDDGDMGDSRTVTSADVDRALAALGAAVSEGTVGAGTGMSCFGYPGGIGTSSRRVGDHHVGVLLNCNFGDRDYLDILGPGAVPAPQRPTPHGSCIAVCATDAPLSTNQLRRLSLRPQLGLARTGSYAADWSGEIGLAFSTAGSTVGVDDIDPFFAAAFEAAQESVYNCLVAAHPATRLDGTEQEAFPVELAGRLARTRAEALR